MGEELPLVSDGVQRLGPVGGASEAADVGRGAVLLREALERLGIAKWLAERLVDARKPELITHPLDELLKTSLLLLGQGYRDADDADVMRDDAVLRLAVSNRKGVSAMESRPKEERQRNHNPEEPDGLASQPTVSRTVKMLSTEENRAVLRKGLLETAGRRYRASRGGHRQRHLTIDVDSLQVEVHGHQPGSAHNGHYHARIYHPLVASCAETGDMLDVQLREGNVHTAEGSLDFILPLVDEVERQMCQVAAVRLDAGFPSEKLLAPLEKRQTPIARVKNNAALDRLAEPHLVRPVGRPPNELSYGAKCWSRDRRVVLVVLERPDELFLHHFWLITNWTAAQVFR